MPLQGYACIFPNLIENKGHRSYNACKQREFNNHKKASFRLIKTRFSIPSSQVQINDIHVIRLRHILIHASVILLEQGISYSLFAFCLISLRLSS